MRSIAVKILLVDLDSGSIEVITRHLEISGFSILGPVDPKEAWRLLAIESPGTVIVEVPSLNDPSWQYVERMREDGRYRTLPTVVLSASLDPKLMDRATAMGCHVLGKPFSVSALLDKVNLATRHVGPPGGARIDLLPVGVDILLDVYRIEGTVHLPPELDRFSDAWESLMKDDRTFVPVTGARVSTITGEEIVASAGMVQVRKEQIRAVNTQGEAYAHSHLGD